MREPASRLSGRNANDEASSPRIGGGGKLHQVQAIVLHSDRS